MTRNALIRRRDDESLHRRDEAKKGRVDRLDWRGAGVNCQERSKGELTETLRITLQALELHRQAARAAAGEGYEEAVIAL